MLCPQHFVGGNRSTSTHPDPVPVDVSDAFVVEKDNAKSPVLSQDNAW